MDDSEIKVTPAQRLAAQVLDAFTRKDVPGLEDMDPKDPFAVMTKASESLFTLTMDLLRRSGGPVGEMCSYAWDVFHHGHVQLAVGPEVPSLHVAIVGTAKEARCLVFVPHGWPDMIKEAPLMQAGAIVFTASQVVDFYNGMYPPKTPSSRIQERASAFEAEFLRDADISSLNEYQRGVVARNKPGGLAKMTYVRRPMAGKN